MQQIKLKQNTIQLIRTNDNKKDKAKQNENKKKQRTKIEKIYNNRSRENPYVPGHTK
jgi:hypothetical protein